MAVPHQTMQQIRKKLRNILGDNVQLDEQFFTYDRDSSQIVSNRKIKGADGRYHHFILDLDGNIIKHHRD